jgi:hypothetical protein
LASAASAFVVASDAAAIAFASAASAFVVASAAAAAIAFDSAESVLYSRRSLHLLPAASALYRLLLLLLH